MTTQTLPGSATPALNLLPHQQLFVKQVFEWGEWLGFETRNKYQISDSQGQSIAFAAEQGKGFLGLILRQFLGHWRRLDVHFFDASRNKILIAHHPFRWYFQRFEVFTPEGKFLGALQQRFSILTKRFDAENSRGQVIAEVASPIWKIWTFIFKSHNHEIAAIRKKWSGLLSEAMTDRDNFLVEFTDPKLSQDERLIIMAASVFVDLQYFEKKA